MLLGLTVEVSIRRWRAAGRQAILGQFDEPEACGFGLFVNEDGSLSFYVGDGGPHMTKFLLGKPAGQGPRVAKLCAASVVTPRNGRAPRNRASGTVRSTERLYSGWTSIKIGKPPAPRSRRSDAANPKWEIPVYSSLLLFGIGDCSLQSVATSS